MKNAFEILQAAVAQTAWDGQSALSVIARRATSAERAPQRRRLLIDRSEQFEHREWRRRTKTFIEQNGPGPFLFDRGILSCKPGIAGKRLLDAADITGAQATRGIPRQERLDLAGRLVSDSVAHRHRGQLRSAPLPEQIGRICT